MPRTTNVPMTAFKILFSLSILAYILFEVTPLREIRQSLLNVNIFWLLLSFSLHALGLLISARRWQILIHAQGDRVPLGFLAQSYLVGNFFNLFLPTRFGGDVVRIWDGSRYSRSIVRSTAVVLVERLTGVIILLLFALAASLYRIEMTQRVRIVWVSLPVGFLGLLVIVLFFVPYTGRWLHRIPETGRLKSFKAKLLEFRTTALVYTQKRRPFLAAMFWAFLLQVNVIVHYFFAGKAFGIGIPLIDYFIFMPIVMLILTIPVTISGLGLREALYIEIFGLYAIPGSVAVSFSLVADIAFTLIIGTIGGILYALRK